MTLPFQRSRENLNSILEAALISVKPETLLKKCISIKDDTLMISEEEILLASFRRIHMIGIGKGAPALCTGLADILEERLYRGIVISGAKYNTKTEKILSLKGDHPVPGENSFKSALKLNRFVNQINDDDLVFGLITGGSSSMAVSPPEGISIDDLSELNNLLVRSGASIDEINTVRKHLSGIKGGILAKKIFPARIISLIISDVIGSDPGAIGSGPFYGDKTSFNDAVKILCKYDLDKKIRQNVKEYLEKGKNGLIEETPSPGDADFKNNRTFIIGKNTDALAGAELRGRALGYRVEILSDKERGDVGKAADKYAEIIRERGRCKNKGRELLLFGGEFTVSVKGGGKGGRVQEFLLLLLQKLKDEKFPFFVAGIGTDGKDGNSDDAGAWINNGSVARVGGDPENVISEYLAANDSNTFFRNIDQLIHTGATGTNVMDIFLIFFE